MITPLISVVILALVICLIISVISIIKNGYSITKLFGVLIATILLVIAIPIIGGDDPPPDKDITEISTAYYDDYIPYTGALVIHSGPIESIEINNTTYVHCVGVGLAEISINGVRQNINVLKAPLDIFMLAGQSNAEHGIYNRVDVEPKGNLGTSYYYGGASRVITYSASYNTDNYAIYDMVGRGVNPIGANVDLPFSATYYELTGHKTLLVNAGVAGSPVLDWIPGARCYEYAKDIFNDALSKVNLDYFEPTIKSYIWIQGEADKTTSLTTYKTRFLQMHNALIGADPNNVFTTDPFDNCLISKVRAVNGGNASTAQIELTNDYETVLMASKLSDSFTMINGLMLGDNLHYSQLGDNLIGVDIAEFLINRL